MQILIGRKTQHIKSPFDVLYAGHDGRELLAAAEQAADKGYARLERITNPLVIPVNVTQHLRQKAEAAERANKERKEAEEAERLAAETKREKPAEKKKAQAAVEKARAALEEFLTPEPE